MFQTQCPNCGANIIFRAGETVFAVCDFCSTALARNDIGVESLGKIAILQDAWSPLQLHTEGDFDGGHFFLVGQVVYDWGAGTWSEWFLSYNDGRVGWLTESQGHYGLSFPARVTDTESVEGLNPGEILTIGATSYKLVDRKTVAVQYAQGELPFRAIPGHQSEVFDFVGADVLQHHRKSQSESTDALFASVTICGGDVAAFTGRYVEFDELRLTNMRQIPGW